LTCQTELLVSHFNINDIFQVSVLLSEKRRVLSQHHSFVIMHGGAGATLLT